MFSVLGVRHHRNFATWSYDMAIYDQAFWLVSEGGQTFMTVRGMDVWGHHLNLIAYVFAPFYRWFGAGPEFLYVVQNVSIALGALPVYLIAKRRAGGSARWFAPYVGLAFAVAYLLYAPTQFIAWINFHPEAMVITPFLFAWYFAMLRRWGWFFTFVVVALAMREDTALAVIMLGIVLLVVNRHSDSRRRDAQMALATIALGIVWYVVATQVIIRHFNAGEPPFYLSFFFQQYGGSFSGIVRNSLRHPNWVVRDAIQPDRIRFYRDLTLPLGLLAAGLAAAPVDGCAAAAGQRDRRLAVRPPDPLPVHVRDDRPDLHRRHRGRTQRRHVGSGRCASGSCPGCWCAPTSPTSPGRHRRSAIATACGLAATRGRRRCRRRSSWSPTTPRSRRRSTSVRTCPGARSCTTGRTRSGRPTGATRRPGGRTAPGTRVRRSSTTSSSIARCSPVTPIRRRSSTGSSPATASSRR